MIETAVPKANKQDALINTSTKIVATLGPSSQDIDTLLQLHEAGVNVFRLNFSHGSHEAHLATIGQLRELEKRIEDAVTIMADLQGPKLRVGNIKAGIHLNVGQHYALHLDAIEGNEQQAQLPHENIFKVIEKGHRLLIDDGKLVLKVIKTEPRIIHTEVMVAGNISSNKGVNIPDVKLPIMAITQKDKEDLAFALEQGITIFALSFVQSGEDIDYLRETANRPIKVVSKLEKPAGITDLENIVKKSDAIMVARGDLGVELSPSLVPVAQRKIIQACRQQGKPVIVATQMLESMTHLPTPTRAEASDVANAVFSGVDAVMLSGETAVGKYPVTTVKMMKEIIFQAEQDTDIQTNLLQSTVNNSDLCEPEKISKSISRAVKEVAHSLSCQSIVSFTTSGSTSIAIAKQRPTSQLIALTNCIETQRFLSFVWGTKSILSKDVENFDEMVSIVQETLLNKGHSHINDIVVITAGVPFGQPGRTNMLRVEHIGH